MYEPRVKIGSLPLTAFRHRVYTDCHMTLRTSPPTFLYTFVTIFSYLIHIEVSFTVEHRPNILGDNRVIDI